MAPDHPALVGRTLAMKSASQAVLKPLDPNEEEKPGWKHTYNKKGIPCKSVATNFRNLKASFPA